MLPSDGEGQHIKDYLSDWLVTFLGQFIQQAFETQRSDVAAEARRLVFYPAIQLRRRAVLAKEWQLDELPPLIH